VFRYESTTSIWLLDERVQFGAVRAGSGRVCHDNAVRVRTNLRRALIKTAPHVSNESWDEASEKQEAPFARGHLPCLGRPSVACGSGSVIKEGAETSCAGESLSDQLQLVRIRDVAGTQH
jgi:hypothetical protein